MNLLLDTHIALWAVTDSPKLSNRARQLILDPESRIWVSVASIWEIAIKHSLKRGDMPISGKMATEYFSSAGYRILAINAEHAAAVETLPQHHGDPFDRLLVAQAKIEPMRLLSHDTKVVMYGDLIEAV